MKMNGNNHKKKSLSRLFALHADNRRYLKIILVLSWNNTESWRSVSVSALIWNSLERKRNSDSFTQREKKTHAHICTHISKISSTLIHVRNSFILILVVDSQYEVKFLLKNRTLWRTSESAVMAVRPSQTDENKIKPLFFLFALLLHHLLFHS